MSKTKILWLGPKVQFRGKPIIDAWGEEMARQGWTLTQNPQEADLVFFGSDSQLNGDLIESRPTLLYFWGYEHERFLDDAFVKAMRPKVELMARCTAILVPSWDTYHELCHMGLPSNLMLPGIDSRTLDIPTGIQIVKKNQIIFISRLEPHKNLGMLIEALGLIEPRPELLVVGPGDTAPYQKYCSERGVAATFTELTDSEKVAEIKSSRLLVHPSSYEGLGLPPLEALYLGTPVLALDTPHMRWLLQEDAYYASTIDGMAGMIAHIFNHEEEAQKKTDQGRQRIANALTLEHASLRLVPFIRECIRGWSGRRIREHPEEEQAIYDLAHRLDWDVQAQHFDPTWARHWRARRFIQELNKIKAKNVLDIGSGAVYPTVFAREGMKVTALDISPEALVQAQEIARKWGVENKIKTVQGRAQDIPGDMGPYDAVILGEILEHVRDPERILDRAWAVVKPGGRILATTPVGRHHNDPLHMATEEGGWTDEALAKLLSPWKSKVVCLEKIAEDEKEPSCYLIVIEKT